MMDETVSVIVAEIERCLALGWNRPVVLWLRPGLERSRRVYQELLGEPMPETPAGGEPAGKVAVTVPLEVACAVLVKHCGVGAAPVVRQLEEKNIPVAGWAVGLHADGMAFAGFDRGVWTVGGRHDYDRVSPRFRTFGEELNSEGPSGLPMRTDDGHRVTIYGRSGGAATVSSILVGAVYSGKLPLEVAGRLVDVPLTEDLLSDFLLKVFASGDGPHQVAEAVRALRQLPGGKEERLLRLLRTRPGLSELHRKVRFELTGDAS
jgi:hypothetical protein